MRLCYAIIAIICCLTLFGCGSGRVGHTAPTNPSSTATIVYHRTGGIAGLDDRLTIAQDGAASLIRRTQTFTFTVDATTVMSLTNALDAIPFSDLPEESMSPDVIDGMTYMVQYQGKTVRMMDLALPDSMIPVVEQLEGIILNQGTP